MTASSAQGSFSNLGKLTNQAIKSIAQGVLWRLSMVVPQHRMSAPRSVIATPVSPRTGNPDKGFEIYRGRFQLAGETINTGAKLPFLCDASRAWNAELHSFSWLADLSAAGSELQRAQGRALLGDWIDNRETHHPVARDLGTTARRLLNLIVNSRFLLERAGEEFERQYFVSLGRHIRWLQKRLPFAMSSRAKLDGMIALAYAAVCLDNGVRFRDAVFQNLCKEVELQLLPDGGHVSRNGQTLVEILLDLLPLTELIERQRIEPPAKLYSAIDRAIPTVRMLCHGDGGLAAFNGVGSAMRGGVRAILDRDEVGGKPVSYAKHTGYARLNHRKTNALVDCGVPPAAAFATRAHVSALAFELSEGPQRIIINCGEPPVAMSGWAQMVRTTAAHSTAILSDRPSAKSFDHEYLTRLLGGPVHWGLQSVECELDRHETGSILCARHTGYARSLGLVHERTLFLNSDGCNLRGEDSFLAPDVRSKHSADANFAIRFHLHPSVKATLSQDQTTAMLLLPDRSGWHFSAKGARLSLEDSVYLVDRPSPQRTLQIVLSGFAARGHKVNWAFKKLEKQVRESTTTPDLPELLL